VRNLDDRITDILKARAKQRGISFEEEIRRTLAASVNSDMEAFARRAAALRAATAGQELDPNSIAFASFASSGMPGADVVPSATVFEASVAVIWSRKVGICHGGAQGTQSR
jgi:plasmid stability protein